jgi:hypothetical protein
MFKTNEIRKDYLTSTVKSLRSKHRAALTKPKRKTAPVHKLIRIGDGIVKRVDAKPETWRVRGMSAKRVN